MRPYCIGIMLFYKFLYKCLDETHLELLLREGIEAVKNIVRCHSW